MLDYIRFSRIAYQLVGFRLFYLIALMVIAALLESIGVSLFLPILVGVESDNEINHILASVFEKVDFAFSFRNVLISMVIFFFLKNGFMILEGSCVAHIVSRTLVHLRINTIHKVYQTNYEYLSTQPAGFLTNALTREFEQVTLAFKMYASVLVKIIYVISYLAIPLVINAKITCLIALLGTPAYFAIQKINAKTIKYSVLTSKHYASLQGLLIQAIHYLKYLKATQAYTSVTKKVGQESKSLGKLQYRTAVLGSITQYAFEPFVILILAGLLFYHVEIMHREVIEIAFLIYLLRRATSNFLSIQQSFQKFLSAIGSLQVFMELERSLTKNKERLINQGSEPNFSHPLRFEQVSFTYQNASPALQDLTFEILPYTTVAFVGASGSGKSTLVNLITGILKPTSGQLKLGDLSLSKLNMVTYQKSVGYITQETIIFNDTLRNNLTLWNTNIDLKSIDLAIQQAGLQEVIDNLENGLDTPLGDGGINLSGGQRQRVMIARELLKQAQLLILDEATSALDSLSEHMIQKSVDHLHGQKTIIIIAHRLSTVQNCDQILVLKDGQIVEKGTYKGLLNANGEFKKMVHQQMI